MMGNELFFCSCWDKDPEKRPSMERVTEVMGKLMELFPGGDVPLQNPQSPADEYGNICI